MCVGYFSLRVPLLTLVCVGSARRTRVIRLNYIMGWSILVAIYLPLPSFSTPVGRFRALNGSVLSIRRTVPEVIADTMVLNVPGGALRP